MSRRYCLPTSFQGRKANCPRLNFTSIPQRHESPSCQPGRDCQPLESLFSRDILDRAVTQGRLTAWQLNGAATIEEGLRYIAISHVWSDGTGTGSWDGLKVDRCLYHFFRKIAREFECEGIWWDTVCFPSKKELRAKALSNMHNTYEKAEITFVHDCFLRNLPWTNAETACIAILMSPWFSRGWTDLELQNWGGGGEGEGCLQRRLRSIDKRFGGRYPRSGRKVSVRHELARNAISNLNKCSVGTVNDLLILLGSCHTSWGRDMAIISGIIVGADIKETRHQQVIYQAVLQKIKRICHANLFHNMPTISNGSSWSPIRLFDMPISPPNTRNKLNINEYGEVVGKWKELQLTNDLEKFYVWNGVHPLIEVKLRSCQKNQDDGHIFLPQPGNDKVNRTLLVRTLEKKDKRHDTSFLALCTSTHSWRPRD